MHDTPPGILAIAPYIHQIVKRYFDKATVVKEGTKSPPSWN